MSCLWSRFSRWKCNALFGEEYSEDIQGAWGKCVFEFKLLIIIVLNVQDFMLRFASHVVIFPQVLKERRENRVTTLQLSSTFLPQANRNKLLQYILGFTLLWPRHLSDPRLLPTKGFYWLLLNNPRCYSVESFTRKCLHVTAANH